MAIKSVEKVHLDWLREENKQVLYLSVSGNEGGILYKMTAVLLAYGWNIAEVVAETSTDGYVKDIFVVKSFLGEILNDELVFKMEEDYRSLATEKDIESYLNKKKIKTECYKKPDSDKSVQIFNPETSDFTLIDIRATDRPGLLFDIAKCFYHEGLEIVSFAANTTDTLVRDSFLVLTKQGKKLEEGDKITQVKQSLLASM